MDWLKDVSAGCFAPRRLHISRWARERGSRGVEGRFSTWHARIRGDSRDEVFPLISVRTDAPVAITQTVRIYTEGAEAIALVWAQPMIVR